MTGIPKYTRQSVLTSVCPTCVQAKQTKASPGHQTTSTTNEPHQGLSIDFAFSGQTSDNAIGCRQYYEGFNGETC